MKIKQRYKEGGLGMKAKGSFLDSKKRLYVDCAECKYGGNGAEYSKCASGWTIKKINIGGCFDGQLMEKYQVSQ